MTDDSRLDGQNKSWSKYSWYRIFLPELLPAEIDRVLYLDCDVCVTDRLDELFAADMTGKAVAGAMDPEAYYQHRFQCLGTDPAKGYVCTGVLMMNLAYWRGHGIADKVLEFGRTYPERIHFPDQDCINAVCQDCKIILSPRYSPFRIIARHYGKEEWKGYVSHPAIIHYAGCAPWKGYACFEQPLLHYWWEAFHAMPFTFWGIRYDFWKRHLKYIVKKMLGRA